MKNTLTFLFLAALVLVLSGCIAAIPLAIEAAGGAVGYGMASNSRSDSDLMMERQKITMKFNSNPDTDAWHDQRQKVAAALGDRVFDQDFARVFDSLTLAISDLELKVGNMERQSGYIAASGMTLSPTEAKAMRKEAVNDWCKQNGFDPTVLDKQFKTSEMRQVGDMMDMSGMMAKYDTMQKGLTFQLVKMGDGKTKVKLRFSDVYYPGEEESYYKLIWQAVDKQIFVDKTVEGTVEKRS